MNKLYIAALILSTAGGCTPHYVVAPQGFNQSYNELTEQPIPWESLQDVQQRQQQNQMYWQQQWNRMVK